MTECAAVHVRAELKEMDVKSWRGRNLVRGGVLSAAALLWLGAAIPRLDNLDQAELYFQRPDRRLVISAGLARAPFYWNIVRKAAQEHGVPEALFFGLALVESGFNPHARSGSGAEGMWQFMPATGSMYGLHDRDDRFSVNKSADAAARYLRDLHRRFGTWELALASYNGGPGRVQQAVRRAGTKNWSKVQPYLRPETHSYVPKIQYLAQSYYPRYLEGQPPPETMAVVTAQPGDTWYGLSRRYGSTVQILEMINRGTLVAGTPVAIPAQGYVVGEGDTAAAIAQRLGVTEEQVRGLNSLEASQPLQAGQQILLPLTQP